MRVITSALPSPWVLIKDNGSGFRAQAFGLPRNDGGGSQRPVFPGLRDSEEPGTQNRCGLSQARCHRCAFLSKPIGSEFRAQAFGLPRNDGGGSSAPSFRGFAIAKSPEPRTDAGGHKRAAIAVLTHKVHRFWVPGSGLRPARNDGGGSGAPSFRGFATAKSPEPRTDAGGHKRAAIAAPSSQSPSVLGSGLRPPACPGMTAGVRALRLSGASRSEEPGTQNRCGWSQARCDRRASSQSSSVLGSGLRPSACPGMTAVVRRRRLAGASR